ncbi:hypothetical protein Bca52824_027301 [Brassica carinata]|uniref:F-box associated beta-propeller type 1 domain-containing protein n=1 Tax=Brassica carinata TaxID=52824 RepID=A0A8X7SI80_BRACI|nr:hypothetical protein Bca52824_027301 [Brassica carinata]
MSNQQPSQLISLQQDGLYLLDFNKTTSLKLNLPFTLPPPTEPVCILHCRGIMCLTLEGHNDLAIWNPSSKEFKRIMMFNSRQTTNPLGFGYDRFSDDYKIVTLIDLKTFIYTFKEKSWRESVPRDTSLDCKFKNRTGTVEDHCMYWIADRSHIKNPCKENTILCFDFVKEEYKELNLPITCKQKFSSWLGVLRGELYIIEHYPCINNDICVWRQKSSDKKIKKWQSEPWINMTKHLKEFKNFEVVFACIARNDDVFIVVKDTRNGDGKVMVYNKAREKFIEVPFGSSLKGLRCMSDYICQ